MNVIFPSIAHGKCLKNTTYHDNQIVETLGNNSKHVSGIAMSTTNRVIFPLSLTSLRVEGGEFYIYVRDKTEETFFWISQ